MGSVMVLFEMSRGESCVRIFRTSRGAMKKRDTKPAVPPQMIVSREDSVCRIFDAEFCHSVGPTRATLIDRISMGRLDSFESGRTSFHASRQRYSEILMCSRDSSLQMMHQLSISSFVNLGVPSLVDLPCLPG